MSSSALRERLLAVRGGAPPIEQVFPHERPQTVEAAYAIAASLTSGRGAAGYKIGATSARGRELLGLPEPFYGCILEDTLHRSPITLRLGNRPLALEAELGCELARDLPPRIKPYTRADAAAAVRKVLPLIEINAPSYLRPLELGGLCLIADNGVNAGAVIGSPGAVRLDVIGEAHAAVSVDGRPVARGTVAAAPDDPLSSLCWLANRLSSAGVGLLAGQVIATGAMAAPIDVTGECTVEADFGLLGVVQLNLVR